MRDNEAMKRLQALFDDGAFTELDAYAKSGDGDVEVVAGFGTVNGCVAYAYSQDITVNGGAISVAQCATIKKVYDLASKTGCPVIGIFDSNGMKLTEGFEALNAFGDVVKASASMSGVCPQISIVAGACLATTALIADMADIVVGVEGADFYVSPPSDVKISELSADGALDIVAKDFDDALQKVKSLVSLLPSNNLTPLPIFDFASPDTVTAQGDALSIINSIADEGSVVELKADYASENVRTALATVMGSTVGFVAFDGNPICYSCAYKATDMIKLCDAYSIPIITLVNSNGVKSKDDAKELIALTKLTSAYATATSPKISVLTGNAVGCAYIILAGKGANADLVYAWDTSIASPLDIDGAVAFLYNDRLAAGEDREALKAEYKDTMASPFTAAACGAVDDIFAPSQTREKLICALDMLSGKRENTLPRKHSVK